MAEPFIGEIIMFAGNFAPKGWALCNGQILSIQQNTALFSILGTTYGGNGTSTFALPDLRSRVPIHAGQGPGLSQYVLGEMSGTENVSVLVSNMPGHNHLISCDAGGAANTDPTTQYLGNPGAGQTPTYYSPGPATALMAPTAIQPTGGNQPVSVLQPFNVVNYIIALVGIFPSRN